MRGSSSDQTLPALDCEIDLDEATVVDPRSPTADLAAIPVRGVWVGPVESTAPPTASQRAAGATPARELPSERRSLSEIWPEPPRKRRLSTRLQLALAGVAVVLVSAVAFGTAGEKPQAQSAKPLDDEMVVSAEELKNRREVRADDFRPRRPPQPSVSAAPEPAQSQTTKESLAARRSRRESNPEDVLSLRKRRGDAGRTRGPSTSDGPYYEGPVYVTAGSADAPASSTAAPAAGPSQRVAAAGTSIPAVLTTPLQLRGDSATIIAKIEGQTGPLRGSRFIGTASAGAARVTIRFRTLVFADGRQTRVDAEAQDEEGGFGLAHGVEPVAKNDEPGSVASDVAQETASDVLSTAIGFNVAGRAVDRYVNGSRTRRSGGGVARTVALPPGTKIQVFLHEAVDLGR